MAPYYFFCNIIFLQNFVEFKVFKKRLYSLLKQEDL